MNPWNTSEYLRREEERKIEACQEQDMQEIQDLQAADEEGQAQERRLLLQEDIERYMEEEE